MISSSYSPEGSLNLRELDASARKLEFSFLHRAVELAHIHLTAPGKYSDATGGSVGTRD